MASLDCPECGQTHPRGCRGHVDTDRDGNPIDPPRPCRSAPIKGATVCRMHGGSTPQVRRAAASRLAEQRAEREYRRITADAEPVVNPLAEFQKLAGRVVKWVDLLDGKVGELTDENWRYRDSKGSEQLRSEVALFERAMAECRQVLTAYARADVDNRLAKIDETIGLQVAELIASVLGELGLDRATLDRAEQLVAARLEAIEASAR